jgi:hypothetical protein
MFSWFWFCKDKNKLKETKEVKEVKADNYNEDDNGNIVINATWGNCYAPSFPISKESIISHTEESIVFKDYVVTYNHQVTWGYNNFYVDYTQTMENKENFIEYKETQIKTFKYHSDFEQWSLARSEIIGTEVISERTPLDVFEKEFKSKYKLIETVDEFNNYLSSTLDCDTWCRKKLYDKMKELGLGDGFINQFADLVGNDLNKYHAMIDLANEVSDKDTLMYLYTYKFSKE